MVGRADVLGKVGSMEQVAHVWPITYTQGRSRGMAAFEFVNGPLRFVALADKALDIACLSYKGINFSFLSKPGLQGPGAYDTRGDEAQRSIMGGLMFTAGFENICAPCMVDGKEYPMHGRIRSTPGEDLCSSASWNREGDMYVLKARGKMREAELFGENLVLTREIRTTYGSRSFTIWDEICNEGFREEPMLLLYHVNIGYPLLDEGTRIVMATRRVTPRDGQAAGHEDRWDVMDAPKACEPEYVFIHEPLPDDEGKCIVGVVNDRLGLGLRLEYNGVDLPYFMEWKSTASGDYALGLEPANASVFGRAFHEERGDMPVLSQFRAQRNELEFAVLDGREDIERLERDVAAIRRKRE